MMNLYQAMSFYSLLSVISQANKAYREGKPIMEDREYDPMEITFKANWGEDTLYQWLGVGLDNSKYELVRGLHQQVSRLFKEEFNKANKGDKNDKH